MEINNRTATSVTLYKIEAGVNKIKSELYETNRKLTEGKIANSYNELGEVQANVLINIEHRMSTNQAQLHSINTLTDKLTAMENSLTSMHKLASDARNVVVQATYAGTKPGEDFSAKQYAKNTLNFLQNELNQTHDGIYIYSGSRTSIAPVKNLTTHSNLYQGQYTANYYEGDDLELSTFIDSTLEIKYGITANNKTFQKFIGALNHIVNSENEDSKSYSQGELEKAYSLLGETSEELNNMVTQLGNQRILVDQEKYDIESEQNNLDKNKREINDVDLVDNYQELIKNSTTLKYMYQASSTLSKLTLLDYL